MRTLVAFTPSLYARRSSTLPAPPVPAPVKEKLHIMQESAPVGPEVERVPLVENRMIERAFRPQSGATGVSYNHGSQVYEAIEQRFRADVYTYGPELATKHYNYLLPIVEEVRAREVGLSDALRCVRESKPVYERTQLEQPRCHVLPAIDNRRA